MAHKIRALRHWKQRFDKNAKFIFRRRMKYAGVLHSPGDPIPDDLFENKTKLRRFWESGAIELAEFEDPNVVTGQVQQPEKPEIKGEIVSVDGLPEGVIVRKIGGPWFEVDDPDGDTHKVKGQKALDELLETLKALYSKESDLPGKEEPETAAQIDTELGEKAKEESETAAQIDTELGEKTKEEDWLTE